MDTLTASTTNADERARQSALLRERFGDLVEPRPETEYPGTQALFDQLSADDLRFIHEAVACAFSPEAAAALMKWKNTNLPHYRREILAYGAAAAPEIVRKKTGLINIIPPANVHSAIRKQPFAGDLYTVDMTISAVRRAKMDFLPNERYLDFGCSSAPLLRTMSAVLPYCKWHGCDPQGHTIYWASRHFPQLHLFRSHQSPPLPIADGFFAGAYAISIWSHFSERFALKWLDEMWRIIRPGGFLMLTTHGPRSLYYYLETGLRDPATVESISSDLAPHSFAFFPFFSFLNVKEGELVLDDWGDAYLLYEWMKKNVEGKWSIASYEPGLNQMNQDIFVLRRD